MRVIAAMYVGFERDWFMIKSGVKQGFVMSGFLFLLCLDWVMRKAQQAREEG